MNREPDFSLTKKDFAVRWFSGTGPGGQHRNKTMNCIEITHIETGIKAQATSSRSRQTNQREAFSVLVARLRPWIKEKLGLANNNVDRSDEVIRNYHGVRNEVKDYASKLRQRYTDVVENADLGDMIEARSEAVAIRGTR